MRKAKYMNHADLLALYKKVQQKDKDAENKLIAEFSARYPNSHLAKSRRGNTPYYREDLHSMYLILTR